MLAIVFPAGDGTVFPGDVVGCVIPQDNARLDVLLGKYRPTTTVDTGLFPESTVRMAGDEDAVLVSDLALRRVAAVGGEEIVGQKAGADDEVSFVLPVGTCWVLNDNLDAPLDQFPDSRRFGPLPYSFVLARALYHIRETGYSVVTNSAEATRVDRIIDRNADADFSTMTMFVDKWLKESKALRSSAPKSTSASS